MLTLNRAIKYIGYHFYIHLDGTIEACRPIGVRGCHAVNHNANSIGICYAGGLDKTDTNGTKIKDTGLLPKRMQSSRCARN